MSTGTVTTTTRVLPRCNVAVGEPRWVRYLLIGLTLGFLALFLVVPLVSIFAQALAKGWTVYFAAIVDSDALSAIRLTLVVAILTGAAEHDFRRRGRVGHQQVRVLGEERADHADRPALQRFRRSFPA